VLELIWTITPALVLIAIAFPSFTLLYLMDEVISPTLTIKIVGLFIVLIILSFFIFKEKLNKIGGLKLYILNKMKDTKLIGKKNNIYYPAKLVSASFSLPFLFLSNSKQLYKKDSLFLPYSRFSGSQLGLFQNLPNGKKYYHINNIRAVNRIGPHIEDIISLIIGSLLGDAYANKRSGEGVRICYRQSIKHKEYLFWLYAFFYNRGYTSNNQPRQYTRTIQNKGLPASAQKIYYGYEFNTFTFSSFNWIHKMFYKNGKKITPLNIYEYLTPLALAVWLMDDGGITKSGVRIASNSFKIKEVELLQDVLISKYKLETTIQNIYIKDQYSIYIKKQSVDKLRNILGSNIHYSMLYKLGYAK